MIKASEIKPDMPVVCSEDGKFAKVDHMQGDKTIKLMKDQYGQHHFIPLYRATKLNCRVALPTINRPRFLVCMPSNLELATHGKWSDYHHGDFSRMCSS